MFTFVRCDIVFFIVLIFLSIVNKDFLLVGPMFNSLKSKLLLAVETILSGGTLSFPPQC